MIDLKNVSFQYNKRNEVFENLNLHLKRGSIYGILGENGVGKTTFLRMLSGLLFPSTGEISVLGYTPKQRQAGLLQKLYYLPETVQAAKVNAIEYSRIYAPFYPFFNKTKYTHYLSEFNVSERKKINELSHGQQRKAMLSFALACNTKLVLLDEPTNGLDIPSKGIFRRLIAEAAADDKCILISTHQVRDLENMIDPIIILDQHQVLLNNSLEEISRKLKFGITEKLNDFCLYSEPALGGYYTVEPNPEQIESKVNIEMLFNAAVQNKEMFIRLFLNK